MVKLLKQGNSLYKETRPWGWFEVIYQSDSEKIKRLYIERGQKTSLQLHEHRSEHWFIEKGHAKVLVNDEISYLIKGGKFDIPSNTRHRIENDGNSLLVVLEVQTGKFLSEDDIIRFEDEYERV